MKKNKKVTMMVLGILMISSAAVFAESQENAKGYNSLADAAGEKADAILDKGEAALAEGEKTVAAIWKEHAPQVKMSAFGQEIRIVVTPDSTMDAENIAAIQSVKLESDKGEFLGLKTYGATEKSREAEFMINPQILKMEKVKITVVSSLDGEYATLLPLEVPKEEPKKEETAPAHAEGDKPVVKAAATRAVDPAAPTPETTAAKKLWNLSLVDHESL